MINNRFHRAVKAGTQALVLVVVQAPVFAQVPDSMGLDCIIEPSREVALSSAVTGILESIEVERGDEVKQGQLLARLNSGVERASVELARQRAESKLAIDSQRERLDLARRSMKRVDTLHSNKMISEKEQDETRTTARLAQLDYDTALEEKTIAELEYKRALEILKLREITSPLDGYVVDRYKSDGLDRPRAFARLGEFVEEQPILLLAQVNPLHVEVIAPVELYRKIDAGMSARIYPEAPIGGELEAVVKTVDPVVDAASGTFRVRLELDNSDNRIPAGIACSISFPVQP